MTREEAIKILEAIRVYDCYPKSASEETKEAIDMAIEALQEPKVRCKDCKWYEPAHILHADGSKTYVDEDAPWVTADVGINCGGQCIHHCGLKIYCTAHNREDPDDYENIVIFRKPNEYCCFGERREP